MSVRGRALVCAIIALLVVATLQPPTGSVAQEVSGEQSIVVILVQFPDQEHTVARDEVGRIVFADMADYFDEVSYGKIGLSGIVTSWYTLPHTSTYYGVPPLGSPEGDRRIDDLIEDAIYIADSDVDFSEYDYVMIVHAGDDEALSGDPVDIWSSWLYVSVRTRDGVSVNHATVDAESDPLGIFAHEFGHILWLPDLYDVYGEQMFVGFWGLMGAGSHNGDPLGSSPSHPMAWSKVQLGWINETSIAEVSGSIFVGEVESLEKEAGVRVVKIPITEERYYLIEVRDKIGFDEYLPGSGVIISLVDESLDSGEGIVRVVDADPSTETTLPHIHGLDDAAFDLGNGKNSTLRDVDNEVTIELLQKVGSSYRVLVLPPGVRGAGFATQPVSIHLVSADGVDLPNATIEIIDGVGNVLYSDVVNGTGWFDCRLVSGSYKVQAFWMGEKIIDCPFDVKEEPTIIDPISCQIYKLTVEVRDLIGLPISGADVSVLGPNGIVRSSTTDGGSAVFLFLPAGNYTVVVRHVTQTDSAEVDLEGTKTVRLTIPFTTPVILMLIMTIGAGVVILVAFIIIRRSRAEELVEGYGGGFTPEPPLESL